MTFVPGGYVLKARSTKDSEVWKMGPDYCRLWDYLLLSVRFKPAKIGPVEIGYGQVLKSYGRIADECEWAHNRTVKRWSKSQVKRMLDWFEGEDMIVRLGTELGTLITVKNFKEYQDPESYRAELGTELQTTGERLENDNKKDKKVLTTSSKEEVGASTEDDLPSDGDWFAWGPVLMGVVRSELGLGQLTPKQMKSSGSILKGWRTARRKPEGVYAALKGVVLMREAGELEWLPPGQPCGLHTLENTRTIANQGDGTAVRSIYAMAQERYHSQGSKKRTTTTRGGGPKRIKFATPRRISA